ncbi:hypothetical protein AGMMS49546_07140 [Spirochaetia bacterium]|nr:hypothetical protein AGMMS49546_07140 [Spirochaetia bacterium]
MAKKLIFIAVMLVILASLGITLAVLNRPDPKAAPAAFQDEREYIIDLGGASAGEGGAASVTIKNSAGEYTVVPGDTASIQGYENFSVDTYYLRRIIDVSGRLVSQGLVTDEETDLAPFGLAPPRAEVRIKPVQGSEVILYIGNQSPDGYNVYAKKEGSPSIYLAGSGDTGNYLKGALDFIDPEISPAPADNGSGTLVFDRITLGGAVRQGEEVNIFDSDSAGAANSPVKTSIRISGPIEARLNMDRGYAAIQTIFGIRASRVAARINGSGDLAKFGLDKPWSTASVSGVLGQGLGGFGLRASKPDTAGKVYIQREGTDLVYEADASPLSWLETSWFDLMDRLIIFPFIDTVSSVEVRTPARTVSFSLSGDGDELKVKALGIDIDTANFRTYYQTLMFAMYDEVSSEKPAPGAKPVMEISYHYRDGKAADTVSFYSTDSRRVLTSFNGGRAFYTFAVYVDRVLADLDQILAGKKVLSYI